MALNNETDTVALKARQTSSKLRAANLAGLKSYLDTRPLGEEFKPENNFPADIQENKFKIKSELEPEFNPLSNPEPSLQLDPSLPAPISNSYGHGLNETGGGVSSITDHSTPRKSRIETSLWPSHRSLDLPSTDFPLMSRINDRTVWNNMSISKPHQTPPSLQKTRPASRILNTKPVSLNTHSANPPKDATNPSKNWATQTIRYVLVAILIASLSIFFNEILGIISNLRIEKLLVENFKSDSRSWMKFYNDRIFDELNRADSMAQPV